MQENKLVTVIIFGGTGKLALNRIIPSLFQLWNSGELYPSKIKVLALGRSKYDVNQYRNNVSDEIEKAFHIDQKHLATFIDHLWYLATDFTEEESYTEIDTFIESIEEEPPTERIFYLSTYPELQHQIIKNIGIYLIQGLSNIRNKLAIEKPFGFDTDSARKINTEISKYFNEEDVFRVDHYLGKETIQNILYFRFYNIFEGIWNRQRIDNIQITVFEKDDISTHAEYYDKFGVFRDILHNRVFQFLSLVTMEPVPPSASQAVKQERNKILNSIVPIQTKNVVLGQYDGYHNLQEVPSNSKTPTFVGLKMYISNWRWDGVPIYIRTGKGVDEDRTEITLEYQTSPTKVLFGPQAKDIRSNFISMCIYPDEGIHLGFSVKQPETIDKVGEVDLEFHYRDLPEYQSLPDPYIQVLLDIFYGDSTYFPSREEVESSWKLIDNLIEYYENNGYADLNIYPQGSDGPIEATELIERDNRLWLHYCVH